jgi:copper(I)-binding protein
MTIRAFLAGLAIAALSLHPAFAHSVKLGPLELTDLWARATPPNAPTGGGYLTIANSGDSPDRLISIATPQAAIGEVHVMKVTDGVMTMRPVEGGLEIPAKGSVTLAPGGFHIMFIDLKEPFVDGTDLPVTLTFEKAGKIETFLHVMPIGSKGPSGEAGGEDHAGHTE